MAKNKYAKKAERAQILAMTSKLETKGNIKNTLIETGKDLLVAVIAGGFAGSAIGKPSLAIGAGVTALGHFKGSRLLSLLGIGMMAANGFQTSSVSGVEEQGMDGVKDRVMAFKNSFSQKLYLDKIIKKKTASVAGIGNLQYFNYANEIAGLEALSNVEEQIENSALNRLQMNGTGIGSADDALPGMQGPLAELSDVSDYIL
ncbi:hypothetical protein [Niastella sp. OAS944]|uniref:hypothetical protein n=1 Tax=Niastella sp. OAS944 TaxID=2664089 RepID=UPI00348A9B91|nr:hypothetical protein [Chitinophagaceae bacterium OAS944]